MENIVPDMPIQDKKEYGPDDFVRDSRVIWGVSDMASAKEIVEKTITVSVSKNKNHAIVTPLERYMKSLGYYEGNIEADSGKVPVFGKGMERAIISYQTYIVNSPKKWQDGELTAKGATWKKLYENVTEKQETEYR